MTQVCSIIVNDVETQDIRIAPVKSDDKTEYHLNFGTELSIFCKDESLDGIEAIANKILWLVASARVDAVREQAMNDEPALAE